MKFVIVARILRCAHSVTRKSGVGIGTCPTSACTLRSVTCSITRAPSSTPSSYPSGVSIEDHADSACP